MTSIDEHKKAIKELEEDIKEKIRTKTLAKRQKIIGFATSEGAIDCLALLLHKKGLITEGFNINHRWFASIKRAEEKFPFEFPHKKKILNMLVREEELRSRLSYGKSRHLNEIKESTKIFFDIKKVVEEEIGEAI